MDYNFRQIEKKWQKYWEEHGTFRAHEDREKKKYYVLDMFPYPSGAGLHVGHPLGYIASDIIARYKRHHDHSVLHPMGFDAFGLPAEQYAIETGQHPALTTEKNADRYRQQLKMLGLSFDWTREVKTCDPDYYRWTQWIFLQFFDSWYNRKTDRAEPIMNLVMTFNNEGNGKVDAACNPTSRFTGEEWRLMNHDEKERILLNYRLAYIANSEVNWCEALNTVLANDEVQNGVSVRGGHPVEKKKMRQWFLRITAYADRLLEGLDRIDWPDSLKEIQRNWIGMSVGAELYFDVDGHDHKIQVFTTRPDTIFGVTFMVLAPEHELVPEITTDDRRTDVENYIAEANKKSDRQRMTEVKDVTGTFTGAYAKHPFTGKKTPVWIADYVLADYGTGAIMAVPGHDSRDEAFAVQFDLPVIEVVDNSGYSDIERREGRMKNSDFLNNMEVESAIVRVIQEMEKRGIGDKKINYRLRDAGFSRQRYWGEPFPVKYKMGVPIALDEDDLPLRLPDVDSFEPAGGGESPLARLADWVNLPDRSTRETNTMPGSAGSSWYFLRYMDPHNEEVFVAPGKEAYWGQVDFYVGGSEHATGHLLYARFWQKFLFDMDLVRHDEPFRKLINQGMIQGLSAFVYREKGSGKFISKNLIDKYDTTAIHVDVSLVKNDELDIDAFRKWRDEFAGAQFILEDGKYIVGREVEKMSKSKYNVVNPDDVVAEYGCDTFRMYEMFLGPVEQSKPWNTDGIEGVYKFLRKFWGLFHDENGQFSISTDDPSEAEQRILHKAIRNIVEDLERFSLNTCVSHFMICINELQKLDCHKREILEPLVVLIEPFAPHMSEELWAQFGHEVSVSSVPYPEYDESWLKVDSHEYPVSVNGKLRDKHEFPLGKPKTEIEQEVLELPKVRKWTEGREVKKIIFVPGKIINIVVSN